MTVIGITGGIGSGKSYVCARLNARYGIPIYDCDAQAKHLMCTDQSLRQGLIHLFGPEAFDAQGQLCRATLARRVFCDAAMLARLNALVHPCVGRHFAAWAASQEAPIVALESAILHSSGMAHAADVIIAVEAPPEVRIARVQRRDCSTPQQVIARMRHQQTAGNAHFTLVNDGQCDVDAQLDKILKEIHSHKQIKEHV